MKSEKYLFFLCFLFSAIGPVSSTLYLPSLPAIAVDLHTTTSLTQLTIALFILGYGIARLSYATISDAFGRRPPLVVGLLVALAGCFICMHALSIHTLLIGRFLQGLGAGGSNVLARVILRDKVNHTRLAQFSSYYSMVNIAAMVSAPLLGGYLQHYFGWRSTFVALILFVGMGLIACIFTLPETNVHRDPDLIRPSRIKTNFQSLWTDKAFIFYTLLLMLAYGCTVAWLTSGPIILQTVLFLTPIEYGWCAAGVGFSYFIGAYVNSHLVRKLGIQKMLFWGTVSLFISSIFMLVPILFFSYVSVVVILIPAAIALFGISLLIPNAYAAGLAGFSKTAGIAVAVLASLQILGGVLSSTILSFVPEQTQLSLGLVFLLSSLLCVLSLRALKR